MVERDKMATISEPTTVVQWQNSWFYSTDSGSIPGGCPRRWKTFCCGHPDAMHQQYGICYSRKELLWILFQIWQHNTHWIKNILRVKKQRVKIIWMFKNTVWIIHVSHRTLDMNELCDHNPNSMPILSPCADDNVAYQNLKLQWKSPDLTHKSRDNVLA